MRAWRSRSVWVVGIILVALIFGVVRQVGASGIGSFAAHTVGHATSILAPHDGRGQTNVLLLGIGGKGHDAPDLTDTMILASIDAKTNSIVLLSLPRDLYVPATPASRAGKINALYSELKKKHRRSDRTLTASGASLKAMHDVARHIGEKLDVPIHGVIKSDFAAFTALIDTLGGVDVDVKRPIVDWYYPVQEGVVGTFRLPAGTQHLDGQTALKYARSRSSTSDFDRSERQQQILTAIADTLRGQDVFSTLTLVQSLSTALSGHIETTLSDGQLLGIVGSVLTVNVQRVVSMQLNVSVGSVGSDAAVGGLVYPAPENFGRGYYLLPVSPSGKASDWSQLQTLAALVRDEREIYLLRPKISVVALERRDRGTAQRVRNELVRYGIAATHVKKIPAIFAESLPSTMASAVLSDRRDTASTFIAERTALPLKSLPAALRDQSSAQMWIVIGKDYTFTALASRVATGDTGL